MSRGARVVALLTYPFSCAAWSARLVALLILLISLPSAAAAAQGPQWTAGQRGEELEVALVTIGPGELYWERFGHNAILVHDRTSGERTLYNYGMFDFAQKNFLLNFLRGRMLYSMLGRPANDDLASYVAAGRWIDVQELNLSPSQRAALREYLIWNGRPENANYPYEYFSSNCSTKVRDALDRALGGAVRSAIEGRSRGYTHRTHALRLTAVQPWLYLGIHAGLGPATDRRLSFWDAAFVPMELERALREVEITDEAGTRMPLVEAERRVNAGRLADPGAEPPRWLWRFATAGFALAAVVIALARSRRWRALGALALVTWFTAGLGGSALLALWMGTAHQSAWRNENLLLFSPLCLALVPAAITWLRGRQPGRWAGRLALAIAAIALLALVSKTLPVFVQDNTDWIALWLPVHAALAWALRNGGSSGPA